MDENPLKLAEIEFNRWKNWNIRLIITSLMFLIAIFISWSNNLLFFIFGILGILNGVIGLHYTMPKLRESLEKLKSLYDENKGVDNST
jgi:hypothetical protein